MRNSLFCLACVLSLSSLAQTKDGGISAQMLQKIQQQNEPTAEDRALRNALAANGIDQLAQNSKNAGELDTYFSVETKKQSITESIPKNTIALILGRGARQQDKRHIVAKNGAPWNLK